MILFAKMSKQIKHLKQNQVAEIVGWIGTVGLLSSYALLSLGIIKGDSLIYHGLLFIGAFGLAVITYRHRAFQSFIVNVVFTVLAIYAIARLLFFA